MLPKNVESVPDPLYGEINLPKEILDLAARPILQRLRHIRLSNIDSLSMPSIANISRYEHSLAVCFLSSRVSFGIGLDRDMSLALQAAALLHDSAIPPMGHLAEEALAYLASDFEHEKKWQRLFLDAETDEIGGFDFQIYMGRQSGLKPWAERTFGTRWPTYLTIIMSAIRGSGPLAGAVAGDIDLDNIDNVSRVAYHMGLSFTKTLPLALAESMVGLHDGQVVFADSARELILEWLELRRILYSHLMLARADFAGKTMLLFSMVHAYERGVLRSSEWNLVDFEIFSRLATSEDEEIAEPVRRWLVGDLWSVSDLVWLRGTPPSYDEIRKFSDDCSTVLKRRCFAYRIKDKRTRRLSISFRSGGRIELGRPSDLWLLGFCSPLRRAFSSAEQRKLVDSAMRRFNASHVDEAVLQDVLDGASPTLFAPGVGK